jgi:GNAT superfamily N-acetyltransferase
MADEPLYDEFGNYIGPALDSDEEDAAPAADEGVRRRRKPRARAAAASRTAHARPHAQDDEAWVAEADGVVAGYIVFTDDWINQLYVHPDRHRQGFGAALLAHVLASGAPKQLWTFQQNERARRFYEARSFRAVEFTDGEGNEEKTPDVRYEWRPSSV